MNPENDLDAWLSRQMKTTPLRDDGFALVVTARVARHQRRRRVAFVAAGGIAAMVAALCSRLLPLSAPALPSLAITPGTVVACLMLVTLCGLAWIDTEPDPSGGWRPQ